MKCTNRECTQKPELRQTGWSHPHPEYVCPVCECKYYCEGDVITPDKRDFKWGKK